MNRKLLFVVAIAAVLALLVGAKVGRDLLSSSTPQAPAAQHVLFKDEVSGVSIVYPASWKRTAPAAPDSEVPIVIERDAGTRMSLRVAEVGIAPVTNQPKSLQVARDYTDFLLSNDARVKQFVDPVPVDLGGLPGWRYRYTLGTGELRAAHDHYFLFKSPYMIQLVFEVRPPARLPALAAQFDSIAKTFRGKLQ